MPNSQPSEIWWRERAAIEEEMDRLLVCGMSGTEAERRVRQVQFAALIERREAAARVFLQDAKAPASRAGQANSLQAAEPEAGD